MDQQQIPPVVKTDNHYMTREFLETTLVQNKERIQQLEEHIQKVTQRSYGEAAERNRMRNEMQEWTLEQISDGTISEDTAQEIADICGFELTKEFEVEVTVMYSVTVNARNDDEVQNAIHEIDFDSVEYNSDSISYLSSSIDNIEVQQGATNNKPEHVLKLLLYSPKISQGAVDNFVKSTHRFTICD